MHFIIKFIHLVLKPILSITPSMKHHSTLLKALLMSSLAAMKPSFPVDLWFRKCINSKAIIMLSVMRWSDVKALWFSMMICGRRAFSLLASVFEMSLYITLHKLMGAEVSHSLWAVCFWDEGYIGFVKFSHWYIVIKNVKDHVSDTITHNISVFLIK